MRRAVGLLNHGFEVARELGMQRLVEEVLTVKLRAQGGMVTGDPRAPIDSVMAGVAERKTDEPGSAAERAWVNVTRAIKIVMQKLADGNPALGDHLASTVKTGTFCSYTPDPRVPISWTF